MTYGIKYKSEIKSSLNKVYKVYILKKDYDSAQIDLDMGGTPIKINYLGDENKYDIIRGSECVLEFLSQYDGQFTDIMIADAQEYQIQVWKENVLIWQGYVIQDNYVEPFDSAPYLISVRATDGLGNLKHYDFLSDDSSFYLQNMTLIEVIQKCLGKLKNGTKLITSVDVFESRIDRADNTNEALNRIAVSAYMFIKDDLNALKCDVVLQYILEIFNCYIYYANGAYYIERLTNKLNETVTRRVYNINFDDTLSSVVAVNSENIRKSIAKSGGAAMVVSGSHTYQTPFNQIQIDSDIVGSENIVVNSYFRNWNGSTIPYNWNKTGTFAMSKLNYPLTGDAIRVTQKSTDAALSYTTNKLTAANVNFKGFNNPATMTIKIASVGNARFLIKANTATASFYLSATPNTIDDPEAITKPDFEFKYNGIWETSPAFLKIERGTETRREEGSWYVTTISDMNITSDIKSLEFSLLPSYDTDKFSGGYRVRQFTPTISSSESSLIEGVRYTATSTSVNKETNSDLQPTLGEFNNIGFVNQLTIDGNYTDKWYRDGKTESLTLFELASQSMLNQYRLPFRQFSATLLGDFTFGAVYTIDGLSGGAGLHLPYKASLNLKNDTIDADFIELLPETDVATDVKKVQKNYKNTDYTTLADPQSQYTPRTGRGSGRN